MDPRKVDGLTVLTVIFQLSVGMSVAHDGKPKKNQSMGSILVEPVGHTGLPGGRSVTRPDTFFDKSMRPCSQVKA